MSEQEREKAGTQYFKIVSDPQESVRDVLIDVYKVLPISPAIKVQEARSPGSTAMKSSKS